MADRKWLLPVAIFGTTIIGYIVYKLTYDPSYKISITTQTQGVISFIIDKGDFLILNSQGVFNDQSITTSKTFLPPNALISDIEQFIKIAPSL